MPRGRPCRPSLPLDDHERIARLLTQAKEAAARLAGPPFAPSTPVYRQARRLALSVRALALALDADLIERHPGIASPYFGRPPARVPVAQSDSNAAQR